MLAPLFGWLQRDPLGLTVGANLYEYAAGTPLMVTDATGTALPLLALIAIIALAIWLITSGTLCKIWADTSLPRTHGNFQLDPGNQMQHCYVNCCMTRMVPGLGGIVSEILMAVFEAFQAAGGLMHLLFSCLHGDCDASILTDSFYDELANLYGFGAAANLTKGCDELCGRCTRTTLSCQPICMF